MTICDGRVVPNFLEQKIWRVNALLLVSTILAGVIVGIGAYGQRYRHHPFTRFIFLGATTLFVPIISSLVSISAGSNAFTDGSKFASWFAICTPVWHSVLVIIWALLVHIVMINTSIVVAIDDREGPNVGPPFQLLAQGVWILYLGITYVVRQPNLVLLEVIPFAVIFFKTVFKYYAFGKARKSFALGQNPRLILRYMQQLSHNKQSQHHSEEPTVSEDAHAPPPLLVMGEEKRYMDNHPHGYMFKDDPMLHQNIGLVTIDRVWQSDGILLVPIPQRLKDLCLSFALFKLLRCQFARYELHNIGFKDTSIFFWSSLLKDGEFDRVFCVIADELSFVHDHYYSSVPISYSMCWLPIVGIFISFLSIGYCIFLAVWMRSNDFIFREPAQFSCYIRCVSDSDISLIPSSYYGNLYFDLVPMLLIIVLVVTVEVRDLLSYACSNWTKVVLISRLLNSVSLQRSLRMQKWFAQLFRCRCNLLMKHWNEKIGQCSLLILRPRTTTTLFTYLKHLLHLPDQKTKVKVPSAVKACIIDALRSSRNGQLSNGKAYLRRWSEVGETFLWACNSNSASSVILTWHIATSILEVRYPYKHDPQHSSPISDHKIAATHISRYCAYLVTWCPELLPDDVALWSKILYKATKKDAENSLTKLTATGSSSTSGYEYHQLVELLSSNSNHEVVKKSVQLAQQVVEAINDEQTAWELLATFWSEMILYVAPSDNLKAHSEAIARGGELITLLWALLNHAGIVSRPTDVASAGTDDDWPSDGTSCPAITDDVV